MQSFLKKYKEKIPKAIDKGGKVRYTVKVKPMRKSSSRANVLFREPQAVKLRYGRLCEWAFEGEPKQKE